MGILASKVVIIGAGFVGASIAYASLIRGLCTELVLIDRNREKAEGEAMDLSHGLPFVRPVEIKAGDYEDCRGAEIIVITAGANQRPGQTRLELVQQNVSITRSIVSEIIKYEKEAILLVVSNPVDILTMVAREESGLAPERVIGSGTVLDTARFRYIISQRCRISPKSIHAYVVGEHGDSEVPLFSSASVAGSALGIRCTECSIECEHGWQEQARQDVRQAAYEIINRKGATYYGIGLSCAEIIRTILRDEQTVLTVSSWLDDQYGELGVAVSVPCVIGSGGVVRRLQWHMDQEEAGLFEASVQTLNRTYRDIRNNKFSPN